MKDAKSKNPITFYLFSLAITTACAMLYYFMYRLPLVGIDDANIYFTYMKNFANGLGFVYNPGAERVEGFTSILYTLIGSAVFLFTNRIELVLYIINILAVSYLIFKVSVFIYNLNDRKYNLFVITLLLTLLLLVMPGYFFWTTLSLMESGIWSLLLCLAILAIFDESTFSSRLKFIILIALLILTRPEAYFWAFYLVLLRALFYYLYHKQPIKRVFKENWLFLFTFICVLGSLLLWRYNYFGYLLPNTYYAKVYGSFWYNFKLGLEYLFSFLIYTNPLILLTLISIGYVTRIKFKELSYQEAVQLILCLVILVALAIPVALGGDYFKWNRFYIVFLPVMYLPLFNLGFIERHILNFDKLNGVFKNAKHWVTVLLFIFILLLPRESLNELLRGESLGNSFYIEVSKSGQELSNFLNNFFNEQQLPYISVVAAGMAYKYNGTTFDLMGLNNTKMAHAGHRMRGFKNHDAFNKEVFYQEKPDIIYDGLPAMVLKDTTGFIVNIYNDEFKSKFINKALDEIWFDEKFQAMYKPVIITNTQTEKHIFTWAGKHYLEKLDNEKYSIKYINIE